VKLNRSVALLLAPALLLAGCVTTTRTTRTWGDPYDQQGGWERLGSVMSIRETVTEVRGDPAGGAVAGAVIGGFLGSIFGGRHHDVFAGALGGAVVGAAASQSRQQDLLYEVMVRYDDGGQEVYAYRGGSPFAVGDRVSAGPQGLERR
jgi:outer membrane lipoprotein SlyB